MFLAHSFRLRDPWQCTCGVDGSVCWSRVFHRPTGLESDDALWLVCSGLPMDATVAVNGRSLAPPDPAAPNQFDLTHVLADANRVEIILPSGLPPAANSLQPASFPYDVRLGVVGQS